MIKQLIKRRESAKGFSEPLAPGSPAPDFTLPAAGGGPVTLSELQGSPVVLVFYPADQSSVCSNQLALYNEALGLFQQHDAKIIGISVDDIESHEAFSNSLSLNFPLLSDDNPPGVLARQFGVYNERDGVCERALFVLDADGVVRWSYVSPRGVNPGADGILAALDSLANGD